MSNNLCYDKIITKFTIYKIITNVMTKLYQIIYVITKALQNLQIIYLQNYYKI